MAEIKLKHCPFCGVPVEIVQEEPDFDFEETTFKVEGYHMTYCPLFAVTLHDYDTAEEAAENWNRRAENETD